MQARSHYDLQGGRIFGEKRKKRNNNSKQISESSYNTIRYFVTQSGPLSVGGGGVGGGALCYNIGLRLEKYN